MRRVALIVVAVLVAAPLTTTAVAKPTRLTKAHATTHANTHASTHTLVADDALSLAFEEGRISGATYALDRARSLFQLRQVRAEYGEVVRPDPHAATLILFELAARLPDLSGEDREFARDILSRPKSGQQPFGVPYSVPEADPICDANVCIHYVASTVNAPSTEDLDADGVPDYAETASAVFQEVWQKEITEMGFRAPKSDLSSRDNGGGDELDVYLQDLGSDAFGYCSTDDPKLGTNTVFANVSSFCVVDNDFPAEDFPTTNGIPALKVTAAHEFFHAVQVGYDFTEDSWLKESTATWMEDEVYDEINDSAAYLGRSPLTLPNIPLDFFTQDGPNATFAYGTWIFFRHLSEDPDFGTAAMRDIWTRLDSRTRDFSDVYSLEAIQGMAAAEGTSLRALYARFAARALSPFSFFEEGATYPSPTLPSPIQVTTAAPRPPSANVTLDHLTSRYVLFTPGSDVATDERLTVAVDLPARVRGSEATLVVMKPGVAPDIEPMILDVDGNGHDDVEFGQGSVDRVVLVLSNASARFGSDCFRGTTEFSCLGGTPTDENQLFAYAAGLGTEVPPVTAARDTTRPRITRVSDGPDPFRVNGRRTMSINFTLDEEAFMKVQIFSPTGRRVLNFGRTVPADRYFFEWNGVSRGRLVKAGKYTYKLRAVDAAGNRSALKRGTSTVRR